MTDEPTHQQIIESMLSDSIENYIQSAIDFHAVYSDSESEKDSQDETCPFAIQKQVAVYRACIQRGVGTVRGAMELLRVGGIERKLIDQWVEGEAAGNVTEFEREALLEGYPHLKHILQEGTPYIGGEQK